jgi:hypothetical protein
MKFLTNQERRLRSNWIPAMGKATYLWLRLYGPGGYLLSHEWFMERWRRLAELLVNRWMGGNRVNELSAQYGSQISLRYLRVLRTL